MSLALLSKREKDKEREKSSNLERDKYRKEEIQNIYSEGDSVPDDYYKVRNDYNYLVKGDIVLREI